MVAVAKQHKWGVAGAVIAALILLGAAGVGIYSIFHRPGAMPFENFAITQITNNGKSVAAAISPDDGRILGVMRTHAESDIVLLRDAGSSPQ